MEKQEISAADADVIADLVATLRDGSERAEHGLLKHALEEEFSRWDKASVLANRVVARRGEGEAA